MEAGQIAAYVVGSGTFLTGLAALLQAKSNARKQKTEGTTIGEAALANAVQVVEEVYDKVTGRMNSQIDELLDDNKRLREDVHSLRTEVATLTTSNGELRTEVATLTQREDDCRKEVSLLRGEVKELKAGQNEAN